MSMLQEVISTVMSAKSLQSSAIQSGSIQSDSIQSAAIRVSKAAILGNLTVSGALGGSAFKNGAGGGAIPSALTLDSLQVDGTLDAGDTIIIGQTAAERANPNITPSASATLQLGPAWRIVGTDNSIDVHFSPDFTNFTKVATLVQLED